MTCRCRSGECDSECDRDELLQQIERLQAALNRSVPNWIVRSDKADAEIEQLRNALKPFARNVESVSLSGALGHITREDLWHARDALKEQE